MGNVLVHVNITPEILSGVSEAARLLGQYEGHRCNLRSTVKREFLLGNLHGNLALEGSTLSQKQLAALMRGERVGAISEELMQAKAFEAAYQKAAQFTVVSRKDLFTAWLLMNEGRALNATDKGISADSWNARMKESLELVDILFRYVSDEKLTHPIVKGSVFHYQMAHIRPFDEANDAVARLWHRLLLSRFHKVFLHAPFEMLLKQNQQSYMDAIGEENTHEGQQQFISFCLRQIANGLQIILGALDARNQRVDDRLEFARMHFGARRLTRKNYMALFQNIGPATASRDLKTGLDSGILEKQGHRARTEYFFI